jgi:hypothetical protein
MAREKYARSTILPTLFIEEDDVKRFIPLLAGLLLFLSAAPSVWACPECRAQVNSGVYSQNFSGTLLVMLLPIIVLALVGVGIKKWLIVPGIVLPFLLQHAVQGWCPPLPLMRRFGIRTSEEIEREKYALKVLRGDFEQTIQTSSDNGKRAERALQAVQA